jgi:hypothetical protein
MNRIASNRAKLIGQRNNKVVILGFSRTRQLSSGQKICVWQARCDCGKNFDITTGNFKRGKGFCLECGYIAAGLKSRKDPTLVALNHTFSSYKSHAELRGLKFQLTKTHFSQLIRDKCFYCHKEPGNVHTNTCYGTKTFYNGIDRKNNARGYSLENCVTACSTCNWMKSNLNIEEFYSHIENIYKVKSR